MGSWYWEPTAELLANRTGCAEAIRFFHSPAFPTLITLVGRDCESLDGSFIKFVMHTPMRTHTVEAHNHLGSECIGFEVVASALLVTGLNVGLGLGQAGRRGAAHPQLRVFLISASAGAVAMAGGLLVYAALLIRPLPPLPPSPSGGEEVE